MFRKEEGGIKKIGGCCLKGGGWYSEKRRAVFRNEESGIQKRGGRCSENCEPVVFPKCGGNTWGVLTYASGSRYR